jgi:hypothetical protein
MTIEWGELVRRVRRRRSKGGGRSLRVSRPSSTVERGIPTTRRLVDARGGDGLPRVVVRAVDEDGGPSPSSRSERLAGDCASTLGTAASR